MKPSKHQGVLVPILAVLGTIVLSVYVLVGLLSQDPLWFLTRAEVPDPERIVIRVEGEEIVLTASAPNYGAMLEAVRKALSAFDNWAPGSTGLSESMLTEYQEHGVTLELYFSEPVDFHLPFNDGRPTALLIPIEGRYAGRGYVFRGKSGRWWAGQLIMSDPQPLVDALSALGFIQP